MTKTLREIQHEQPPIADFILRYRIIDSVWAEDYDHEQLWARDIGNNRYEIRSIPFTAYNMTIGDIVEIHKEMYVTKVIKETDHISFRIFTKDGWQRIVAELEIQFPSLSYEAFSDQLVAIDVDNAIDGKQLADFLQIEEDNGRLQFETLRQ